MIDFPFVTLTSPLRAAALRGGPGSKSASVAQRDWEDAARRSIAGEVGASARRVRGGSLMQDSAVNTPTLTRAEDGATSPFNADVKGRGNEVPNAKVISTRPSLSRFVFALLTIMVVSAAHSIAAQDTSASVPEAPAVAESSPASGESPQKKPRRRRAKSYGEVEPHRFIFTATTGIGARLWGGDVTGLRFTPLMELGVGVNFNRTWGLISLTRLGFNDLDHGRGNYAGWSVIGLHRHKPRQANTWGLGIAFREVRDAGKPGGYRRQYGGDALWRVDFLDKPFTYYFASDLACYPGQCALGFSGGVGFYF